MPTQACEGTCGTSSPCFAIVFEQAKALTSLDGKPLIVLTATESLQKHESGSTCNTACRHHLDQQLHRVADATHAGLTDDKESFESSVYAIVDVIQSVRTDQPVAAM
jgi:hypothetical protein